MDVDVAIGTRYHGNVTLERDEINDQWEPTGDDLGCWLDTEMYRLAVSDGLPEAAQKEVVGRILDEGRKAARRAYPEGQ